MPPILYGSKKDTKGYNAGLPSDTSGDTQGANPNALSKGTVVESAYPMGGNAKLGKKSNDPSQETSSGQDTGEAVGNAAWQVVTLGAANLFGAGEWGAKIGKELGGLLGGKEEDTAAAKYNKARQDVGDESEKNAALRPGVAMARRVDEMFSAQNKLNDFHNMKKQVYQLDLKHLI